MSVLDKFMDMMRLNDDDYDDEYYDDDLGEEEYDDEPGEEVVCSGASVRPDMTTNLKMSRL